MKNTPSKLADAVPDALQYALPETKGQCLYAICRAALRDPTMVPAAQRAALAVAKMTVIQPDLEARLRYMTPDGEMGSLEGGKAMMGALFNAGKGGLPGGLNGDTNVADADDGDMDDDDTTGLDQVALSGDFEGWYERYHSSLAERWPRGHAVVYRGVDGDKAYNLARTNNDHRLFSSEGWNSYYPVQEGA